MTSSTLATYAKAVCGAIVAGGGAAATAASDGYISLAEGCIIVVAFFGALGGVAAVKNVLTPDQLHAQPNLGAAATGLPPDAKASLVWPPVIPASDEPVRPPEAVAAYLAEPEAQEHLAAKHPRDSHGKFTKKGSTTA